MASRYSLSLSLIRPAHGRLGICRLPWMLVLAGVGACGSTPGHPEPGLAAPVAPASPKAPAAVYPNLHVPSPEWQDQIIYFLMTDRFADGDPSNNDQGANEYDPTDPRKYSGGDLQGIIDKLDYIQGLGATAVWITPPVANQWWDPLASGYTGFGGYHGYWAQHFQQVDAHLGTLDTYKALSSALHQRGIYLIQDIVTNHVGNFFSYEDRNGVDRFDPRDPARHIVYNRGSVPITRPTQPPFDQNDITNPAHRAAGIYHWTPNIEDFSDDAQLIRRQLMDLDDLATENPVVRQALKDSYSYWIREVGVDGFRIDTALYVEQDFWHDFHYAPDGILGAAAATGRTGFLTFGEATAGSAPLDDSGERRIAGYLGSADTPGMGAMLDFPRANTLRTVFADGKPTSHLAYRLRKAQEIYKNHFLNPIFLDNHDGARFLSLGSKAALEQALLVLFTTPGIPVIYYGTEQGFTEARASMFASGWGSGGRDHFDRNAELYRFIHTLATMRTGNKVFTRGALTVLQDDPAGAGVLAYARTYEDKTALIILNTAERTVLLGNLDTGLPPGTRMDVLASLGRPGSIQDGIVIDGRGSMTMELPPRAGIVLITTGDRIPTEAVPAVTIRIATPPPDADTQVITKDLRLTGTMAGPARTTPLLLVVDGNLDQAIPATVDKRGAWSVVLPMARFMPGRSQHTLALYAPQAGIVSPRYPITVDAPLVGELSARATDPAGDDTGPGGKRYTLPTDPSYGKQMDIRAIQAIASTSFLEVTLTMGEVSNAWTAANGFDHVLFHIYIDLPGTSGSTVLPRIRAHAPAGFAWDYMLFAEGWNNSLYSAAGASADSPGAPVTPAARIRVNRQAGQVSFLLPAESLGMPASFDGTRIYVTTWDWNGVESVYRPLTLDGGQWVFGQGNGAIDPLILDDTAVIELRPAAQPRARR